MILGGVEAGGTKVVCVTGTPGGRVLAERRIATGEPGPTLAEAAAFFREEAAAGRRAEAIGVASFGPLDLRPGPGHGRILSTPKPGWSGAEPAGLLGDALGVPVSVETDVTAAALAEGRWGAARGLASYAYVTVGTGIGVGAVVGGAPVHGLPHPEAGHVAVPRQAGDDFAGLCPFHGDCLEGMASGPAMAARWGAAAEELEGDARARALEMEAGYLAAGLRAIVYALAPERIVMGGGVGAMDGLVALTGASLRASLGGYPGLPEHDDPGFVRAPALGAAAGARGALLVAARAILGA